MNPLTRDPAAPAPAVRLPERWAPRLLGALVLSLVLLEGAFRVSGAHRFEFWLLYGYGTEQGIRELGQGKLALYSSANRRFWPRETTPAPAPGVWRIVVVGDSVARGSSVENNWPQFAERALNQAGCRVDILNLSSGGYGSARKKAVVEMALARLQPHWIVYQASITTEYEDRLDLARRDEAAAQPWRIERFSWAALWLKERKFDILYSRWLSARIREQDKTDGAQVAVAAKTDIAAWYPQVLRNSREIAAMAQQRGVGLVVAPRFGFERATGRLNDMRLNELARQVVDAHHHFDWSVDLGSQDLRPLFADGAHFTRAGNEWIGGQFAQWWQRQGHCG